MLEASSNVPNAGALVVRGYSIDSRTIAPDELFFAVRGERFDGHDFVAGAVERGAIAAVVSRARVATLPDAALAVPLLIADDPLIALQGLATHVRRQWGKRVIAVTGSAGKTTTKEAIAAALGAKFNVLKSKGNLNNGYGLPLQLLRLEPEHEFAVVEMGMNHASEIAALARIATPDWGVVTNVGTAHVENFADGQAGIARAKFELVASLPANGVAFLNCDDPYVSQFGRDFAGKAVYFGCGPCADPQILVVGEDESGLQVRYRSGNREADVTLRSARRSQRAQRDGRPGRGSRGRSRHRRCRRGARVTHPRRQARRSDRSRRNHDSQRQLQLQPRGSALHDSHPGRTPRPAAASWSPERCSNWANTARHCTRHAAGLPPKPESTS